MTRKLTTHDTWELAKLSMKACQEHNATTHKLAEHIKALWTEIECKNNKINELNETVSEKENYNNELLDQNSELIGRINEVEDQLKECNGTETSRAQYEKRFAKFLGHKVDN
jgi:uncharacterized coiled-coil DUF342 family protein